MHENGNYYVQYGSIYSRANSGVMFDEDTTIIVDKECGTLLKVGRKDQLKTYYDTMCQKYNAAGLSHVNDNLMLITFHVKYDNLDFAPEGYNFDIDEICTIINWFNNSIGNQMKTFLDMPLEDAKTKIKQLQKIGF